LSIQIKTLNSNFIVLIRRLPIHDIRYVCKYNYGRFQTFQDVTRTTGSFSRGWSQEEGRPRSLTMMFGQSCDIFVSMDIQSTAASVKGDKPSKSAVADFVIVIFLDFIGITLPRQLIYLWSLAFCDTFYDAFNKKKRELPASSNTAISKITEVTIIEWDREKQNLSWKMSSESGWWVRIC
jgi:hypothetical protein